LSWLGKVRGAFAGNGRAFIEDRKLVTQAFKREKTCIYLDTGKSICLIGQRVKMNDKDRTTRAQIYSLYPFIYSHFF
jgi:hypothetical protein